MRNTLLSRPLGDISSSNSNKSQNLSGQPAIPSIRLVTATPSATGLSSEASSSNISASFEGSSWGSFPSSVLAPKTTEPSPKRRLVPKKSKLGLLNVVGSKDKENRRGVVDGAPSFARNPNPSIGRDVEIYVDPTMDPDIGEILMVKKKKSRAALDGMRWGPLGEATNVSAATAKNGDENKLKVKGEEKEKWWSIGRGRKDSKDKTKEGKENIIRAKSPEPSVLPPRSKTPEPLKLSGDSRARFNSLDSGVLLNSPVTLGPPIEIREPEITFSRAGTPTAGGLLAPPPMTLSASQGGYPQNQGSIAVRAMRSVRSIARIGSWAQLRKESGSNDEKDRDVKMKGGKKDEGKKEKEKKDKEKKTKKEKKDKKKEKERDTLRVSTSSFEAGALSPAMPSSPLSPLNTLNPAPHVQDARTLGKKVSILGLGLPSSMRLPSLRSGSTASSILASQAMNQEMQHGPTVQNGRLSVDSGRLFGRGRSGSVMSTGSSLRPLSSISSHSRNSVNSGVSGSSQQSHSNGSGCSVKWDEEGLETVREKRRREREEKTKEGKGKDIDDKKTKKEKKKGGSQKRPSEGRKRTAIADIFPDISSRRSSASNEPGSRRSSVGFHPQGPPLLVVEEATCDGHGVPDDFDEPLNEIEGASEIGTPSKRTRPRPVSEQLLGRTRPLGMYQDDEGVISMLDAATNDLAQLIMTLNLEATPNSTPNATPLKRSPKFVLDLADDNTTEDLTGKLALVPESPLHKTLRKSMASISSLRPYAQSLRRSGSQLLLGSPTNTLKKRPSKSGTGNPESLIGQQIAPWSKLVENLSPKKMPVPSPTARGLKGSITSENISRPTSLRPSASPPSSFRKTHRRQTTPAPEPEPAPVFQPLRPAGRPKSKATNFVPSHVPPTPASMPRSVGESESSLEIGRGAISDAQAGLTTRDLPSSRTFGSPHSALNTKASSSKERKVPIPPETRKVLGMSGTLGTESPSIPPIYAVSELDVSDPDSDVPDELRFILAANCADEVSFRAAVTADDEDDTFSFPITKTEDPSAKVPRPSGLPPSSPLPVPSPVIANKALTMELPSLFRSRVVSVGENLSEKEIMSEEDTARSFDFTGELKRLDESGGSDRKSFVEQLENAFKTPAKVELTLDLLGGGISNVFANAPPIPNLPFAFAKEGEKGKEMKNLNGEDSTPSRSLSGFNSQSEMFKVSKLVDENEPVMIRAAETGSESEISLDMCASGSQILNMGPPTLPPSLRSEDEEVSRRLNNSTSTTLSHRSSGKLNTSFKFGGLPKPSPSPTSESKAERPLTLSDIIPPLSHARSLAESSFAPEEEDSVLKSIYAKAKTGAAQPRPRLVSNASSRRKSRVSARSFLAHSRPASIVSFTGLDSFEEIRRNFEFSGPRPIFYPPTAAATRKANHRQQDSVLSIASVSSYGRITNPGITDPFGFILPSLQERPSSEDISSATFSFNVDDTFSFMHHPSRRIRVDSDASSFYFRPPLPNKGQTRGHRRQESSMSYMSTSGPPISFYNRSFAAHRKTDSNTSASSIALSYAMHGASGGRAAWAKHRQDPSIDSIMSDISALKLGRPGLGDKMFDTTFDQGMPLSSISASPPEPDRSSFLPPEYAKNSLYDSILDVSDEPKSSGDSLFDKTGHQTSVMSDSVFGSDSRAGPGFQPWYRPLSVISLPRVRSPQTEDDTWISMIGGGHVRRNSVASVIQASPCARVEKRKAHIRTAAPTEPEFSPKKVRIVEKPSIMSSLSSKFGDERMIKATHGLLERQSLEDSCLVAEGEDVSISFRSVPVFSRPPPAGRSRSSTCTSSSGGETPPLSSDGSSISGGSQSSIDLAHLDSLLANATFPVSNPSMMRSRVRPRARGHGHRRRYSAARASRSSVYETIEEEAPNANSPLHTARLTKPVPSPTTTLQPIIVMDSDTGSIDVTVSDGSFWISDQGVVALNKYYALRHEVEDAVSESKRQWIDTPFSIFATQNFQPPRNPEGMKALLQQSVQNFGPLPSELRSRRRNRTHSRPSPYPLARVSRVFYPPGPPHASTSTNNKSAENASPLQASTVLQEIPINSNVASSSAQPKMLSPEKESSKRVFGQPSIRPRVASNARRAALGWTKRPIKSSNGDQKENKENVSYGSIKTPGDSLRLNRPRPRGRATPATQPRPIRV